MIELIDTFQQEYEDFVTKHPKGHIFQSYLWQSVKPAWKWRAVLSRNAQGQIRGSMAVLIRRLPATPYTLMYAPRGPVCALDDQDTLAELTQGAAMLASIHKSYVLKLDPDVPDEQESFTRLMEGLGYRRRPEALDFSNIQPQHVVRLDLSGKTEQTLLDGMKSKVRYNIRLAQRKGVEVRVCGPKQLDAFQELMEVTGQRDGFCVRSREYFENMLTALGRHARLYMAYFEGLPIAGTICLQYGNKTWYAYGASANHHRELMPNYLLQWRMIQWALESGCTLYDFRGVPGKGEESSLDGLTRFKSGWGGEFTQFIGELEYVYHPMTARAAEHLIHTGRSLLCLLHR